MSDQRLEGVVANAGVDITSFVTVTARIGPDEVSAIIAPAGTPRFGVEPAHQKMGWHASDTHGRHLAECRVPADHLLQRLAEQLFRTVITETCKHIPKR